MPRSRGREVRVGLLLLVSLAVLAVATFFIGDRSNLFARKNEYFIRFQTVSGLKAGNPVQLNGVEVGKVERVILPQQPDESTIQVWISIVRRYSERVRGDSQARIKTLGLLGDKYVEVTSGSPESEVIASGAEIPAAPATSVDQLLASGEDTMDNVVAISASLRNILERMERGEGLLGQLTTNTAEGERFSESVVSTMETIERVARTIDRGEGPLPRLLNDRELADRLDAVIVRMDTLLRAADEGDGLLPGLLHDAETKATFDRTLDDLSRTSAQLSKLAGEIESSDGLLQRLLTDEEYGREVTDELRQLIERLNRLAGELDGGDGTAARLIHDPSVYQAIEDIIVGIDESRLLRWLIRNRQKKGIEKRYEEVQDEPRPDAASGGGPAAPAGPTLDAEPPTPPEAPPAGPRDEGAQPRLDPDGGAGRPETVAPVAS